MTATAMAMEQAGTVAEPVQADLLGLPMVAEAVVVRGRGRPAGARNRRTQEWADFLIGRHGSPLEVLAQIAVAPIDVLARELQCSRIQALEQKRQAAVALAPYVHERMPLAVNLEGGQAITLIINQASGASAQEVVGAPVMIAEIEENQCVDGCEHHAV